MEESVQDQIALLATLKLKPYKILHGNWAKTGIWCINQTTWQYILLTA
jgi:hypothetical protein